MRVSGGRIAGLGRAMRCAVYARNGWKCCYCSCPLLVRAPVHILSAATVDHVVPIGGGGRTHPSNMVACCAECNVAKAARTDGLYADLAASTLRRAVDLDAGRVWARELYPRERGARVRSARLESIGVNVWPDAAPAERPGRRHGGAEPLESGDA